MESPVPENVEVETPETIQTPEEGASKPKDKAKSKGKRQLAIPKDSATFFRARAKDLKMFKFTAEGDLQVPEMRGEPAKVIPLPFYRPINIDERREMEEKQFDEIQGVEREFDETKLLLKEAIKEWRTSGYSADVIKYQRDLQRLDAQRTALRSPLRWTQEFKNLSVRQVLLSEIYEVRKIGYPVSALRTRTMTFEQMVKKTDTDETLRRGAGAEAEDEAEDEEAEEESFVVFFSPTDPEHGVLSPDTMIEFIFNATKYNCPIQAYETEKLTMLGHPEIRPKILKSRNPRAIRLFGLGVVGQVENPRELWISILKALVSQHPHVGDALRQTGTSTIVYADPRDGVSGIGLAVEDPNSTNKSEWKGKNYLGEAWTAVRDSLPPATDSEGEAEEAEAIQQGGYTEHGTTEVEARETRQKVLMGKYRRKF